MSHIKTVQVYRLRVPLKEPYTIAIAKQVYADYVYVRIFDENGNAGVGEAAPLPGDTPDTAAQIFATITEYLAKTIIGHDPFDIESIHMLMDQIIPLNLYAKGAIDIALYDYCCRRLGISLSRFIGGSYRKSVGLVGSVGIYPKPAIAIARAQKCIDEGYETLKIKISGSNDYDQEVVKQIRQIGKNVNLRLDANQCFSRHTALLRLRKLEAYDPDLFEQPLPVWDLEGMHHLANMLDTPIVADEAISTPNDVLNTLARGSADMIKVKVMRCGGIYRTKQICSIAEAAGLPVIIGSGHQSSIGVSTELHLAGSTRIIDPVGEMVGHLRLSSDVVRDPIVVKKGEAEVPTGHGIGFMLADKVFSDKSAVLQSEIIS